jgi:hypothetical protein
MKSFSRESIGRRLRRALEFRRSERENVIALPATQIHGPVNATCRDLYMLASRRKMRYNRKGQREMVTSAASRDMRVRIAAGGENTMILHSWRKLVAALFFSLIAYFAAGPVLTATGSHTQQQVELDHVIPRAKWAETGLDKLSAAQQQTLADEITGLLGAARSAQSALPAAKDRSQWRMLERRMSKDEVKKLLGEPSRISVSRFFESWDYSGGSVTFDGKGRVDSWIEP